jgi:hypothetical protein
MDVVKIANIKFNKNIEFLHMAFEPIIAFSVVFGVSDGNITKVYTSQNATFDNGTPWVMGISQNNAQTGETVQVQYFGLSKVRFYSRNVPVNKFIYLLNDSNGVCCLHNEADIETFKRNGKSIMIGNILPRTQPIMGSTLNPREMLVDCYINIDSSPEPMTIVLNQAAPVLVHDEGNNAQSARGDVTYFESNLTKDGNPFGTLSGIIETHDVVSDGTNLETRLRNLVFELPDGQIIAKGASTYVTGPDFVPLNPGNQVVIAIIGGTGAYLGASGELVTTRNEDNTYLQVLRLIRK